MIRSKKYITGDFVEWEVFNVPENIKPFKRQTKIKESTPAQRNLNNKKAQRHFVRLVHNNFCERDLYIDLTYDGDNIPREREEILRDVQNYVKRLQRWRKKNGMSKLKYIYVISNCDQNENKVRYHVHMIINDMDRDVAEKKWGKGTANTDRLQFNESGVTGKSLYMARQSKGDRSWGSSTNLAKPEAIVSDKKIKRSQLEHMAAQPDDRLYIEKIMNGKNREWTFTDCIVERDGKQMTISGVITDNGIGNGTSLLIRARKSSGYNKQTRKAGWEDRTCQTSARG